MPLRSLSRSTLPLLVVSVGLTACGPADAPDPQAGAATDAAPLVANPVVRLLADGQAVFGIFSGEMTPGGGMAVVRKAGADFILYSLEDGPFDIPTMQNYMRGMMDVAGPDALSLHPVILRVPPIAEGADEARAHVAEAVAAGVKGIVFPHVQTAEQAATAVDILADAWPAREDGTLVNILIVEDQEGIANVRDIVATPGLSVVFAGPGDLRRAYDGDMEAVEEAIQAVLAACREFQVACGVTAGPDDIARRLEEGFRVVIVLADEALAVGRAAAGRSP